MPRKLKISRHGLDEDPRGLHVTFDYGDRFLIGEVSGGHYRQSIPAGIVLQVRHFNGDPWPLEPFARSVSVLERQ